MGHNSTESTLSVCSTLHCMPVVALLMHRQLPQHQFVKSECRACLSLTDQVAASYEDSELCRSVEIITIDAHPMVQAVAGHQPTWKWNCQKRRIRDAREVRRTAALSGPSDGTQQVRASRLVSGGLARKVPAGCACCQLCLSGRHAKAC